MDKFKKNLLKNETSKKLKSTINFEETLERFNKKKSKGLTINDLQLEITTVKQEMLDLITSVKQEMFDLKNDFKNLKEDLILLKIDKSLDQQIDNDSHNIFLLLALFSFIVTKLWKLQAL